MMPRPEDRFSNTVEDAAAYENWRSEGEDAIFPIDKYDCIEPKEESNEEGDEDKDE
jgi:hypothetical protein